MPQVCLEIGIARTVGHGFAIRRDRPANFAGPKVGVSQVKVNGPVAKSVGEQRFQKGRRLMVIRRGFRGIEELERTDERSLARSRFGGESRCWNDENQQRSKRGRSCASLTHLVPGRVSGAE